MYLPQRTFCGAHLWTLPEDQLYFYWVSNEQAPGLLLFLNGDKPNLAANAIAYCSAFSSSA